MSYKKLLVSIIVFVFSLSIINTNDVSAKIAPISYDKKCYDITQVKNTKYKNGKIKTKTITYEGTSKCTPFKAKMTRYYNTKGYEIKAVLQEYGLNNEDKVVSYSKVTYSKYKKSGKYWGYTLIANSVYDVKKDKKIKVNTIYTKTLPNGKRVAENSIFYKKNGKKQSSYYSKFNTKGNPIQTTYYYYASNGKMLTSDCEKYDKNGDLICLISYRYNAKGKIVSGTKNVYEKNKITYYKLENGKWVLVKVVER